METDLEEGSPNQMTNMSRNPMTPQFLVLSSYETPYPCNVLCHSEDSGNAPQEEGNRGDHLQIDETTTKSQNSTLLLTEEQEVEPAMPNLPVTDREANAESFSESYFKCIGQLRHCSEKIADLVNGAVNSSVIHYESAFTEIKDTCEEIKTLLHTPQNLARSKLEELLCIPDDQSVVRERDTPVEHDPARRPEKLTEGQIKYLIHIGPCQPTLSTYPKNPESAKKGKQCSFSPTWYRDYPYLEYSVSSDKAFCHVCTLFGRGGPGSEKSEYAWITGISNWSKMKGSRGKNKMGKLDTHFGSEAHSIALRAYLHFVCEDKHVDKLLTKVQRESLIATESQLCKNREVVEMLFDVVRVLAKNGLALRGCESADGNCDGNFCDIVHLLARHNSVMKSWLENRSGRSHNTTYMSPQSQNEFLMLLGQEIREEIRDKVNRSGYCSVMADTTPDVSHSDELSVAVRFVDADSLEPEERLVRIMETTDKTGEGQAKDIVQCLKNSDIPLSAVQFQTYDSTSSMSGVYNGAQQKLSEILERKVPYTKCTPHGVNLVIEHGCQASPLIGKVYDILEQLFVFFTKSTKRHKELRDKLEKIENALLLRNLSKTRWAARAEAVKAVWVSLDAIIEVLRELENSPDGETKTKASGLINCVVNIDFICGLMFLKNIMFKTKMLSDCLQGESINIAGALIAIESTKAALQRIRVNIKEVEDEIQAAIAVASNYDTDPLADFARLHRVRRPSRRLDDNPGTATTALNNISSFYRCEFFKFLDSVIAILGEKYQSLNDVFRPFLKVIDPEKPGTLEDTKRLLTTLHSVFSSDSSAAVHNEFQIFFEHLLREWSQEEAKDGLEEPQGTITKAASASLTLAKKHGIFKTVARVYQLFLTAAPSVCKNERSFSTLKRVKNYLRSTMSGTRLNDCLLLAAERDLTERIDLKKLAMKWSLLKDRRQKIA